jgi:hypothetical protein
MNAVLMSNRFQHRIAFAPIIGASQHENLVGSSSLSGKMDLLQWQHSRPQQFDACAAEHGPLECFQSVDLAFGLATAPWFGDSVPDGVDVTGQYPRELL